jgi:hypothetical protein
MPQLAVAAVFAYAGGAAATAAGFAAYAGVAASVAWGVGSMVGQRMFGPDTAKAALADMRVPKLQMGSKMQRVYGTVRVALSPRWQGEWVATENSAGGKGGGGSEYYTYSTNVLYWLADVAGIPEALRPPGIRRLWWNGELVWSLHPDADEGTAVVSGESDKWDDMQFHAGAENQLPWPPYEAALGAANADAHRRVACVSFENLRTGTWTNLPLLEAEVSGDVSPVRGYVGALAGSISDTELIGLDIQPGDVIILYVHHSTPAATFTGPAGYTENGGTTDALGYSRLRVLWREADGTATDTEVGFTLSAGGASAHWVAVVVRGLDLSYIPPPGGYVQDNTGLDPAAVTPADGTSWFNIAAGFSSAFNLDIGGPYGTVTVNGAPSGYTVAEDVTGVWSQNNGSQKSLLVAYSQTDPQLTNATENPATFTTSGSNGTNSFGYHFTRIPFLEPVEGAGSVDLADIVSAECLRSGLTADDIDVTELVGIEVRGFIAQGSAREAIEDLMSIFHFYAVCSDKLYFRLLDAESVVTIPYADSGAGVDRPGESFTGVERGNDLEVPSEVTVVSPNPSADYDAGAETSDRLVTAGRKKAQVQSLVVLTPEERKGRANAFAMDARTAMHTSRITLDDTYAALEPGDVFTPTDEEGSTYVCRITRESYADGIHDCELRMFDRSDLVTTGVTSDTYSPVINLTPPADTELVLIDTGLLRDEDDGAHILAAVKPASSGRWSGAAVYRSVDDAAFSSVASTATRAVIGESSDALGDFDRWTWDEANTVTVNVGDGSLVSSSRSAMQADSTINVAAIGADGRWEIIRYRTATLVSPGVYTLSGLLRGMRGTESHRGDHEVGDTFVALSAASLTRVSVSNAEIGVARYWKGVTIGQQVSSVDSQEVSPDAVALEPWAPTRFRVARDGSNNATLSWTRRTRLAVRHGGVGGSYMPLGEAVESYEVDIYDDDTFTTVVRTLTSAAESVAYSAANQTSDGLTPGDPINARIYQVSAVVGRGYPLERTA